MELKQRNINLCKTLQTVIDSIEKQNISVSWKHFESINMEKKC